MLLKQSAVAVTLILNLPYYPDAFNFGNSFGFSDNAGAHGCEDPNCWSAFHQDGNDGVYQIQSNGWDINIGLDYVSSSLYRRAGMLELR